MEVRTKQNIPSGWKQVVLGDLVSVTTGKRDANHGSPDGQYPFFTCGQKVSRINNFAFDTEAVLIAGNGDFNVKYCKGKFDAYQRTYILSDFKNTTGSFIYQKAKQALNEIIKNNQGSSVKFIKMGDLTDYPLLLPPINEQQKIAEILGAVDDEIAKTQEVIEATEKLKRGLMQQLFTRGIGHAKFKETEFGRIPDEWEVKELKDVSIKIGDGLHGTPEYSDGSEYYFINGNNIYERGIKIYPETKKISVEQHQLHKKELTSRSILLSINGTIGNIGFYRGEKVALGKSIAYINCDDEINKEFVAYQLETQRIYKYFAKELTGTTIKNLSLGTIRQMPVFVPKKEEQQRIANILSTIDEKISVNKKLKEKFTLLKKGLMQDLLSGRVRAKL